MDLIDAALHVAENNAASVEAWLTEGRIARAELSDAEDWHARQHGDAALHLVPTSTVKEP